MIEDVVYQNPLLFLKIWEIRSDPASGPAAASERQEAPAGPDLEAEPWLWHFHKEVEFLVIKDGRLGVQTKHDYTVLGPGDVIVLGSSQLHRTHRLSPNEPLSYIVFQVDLTQHFDQSTLPYLSSFSEHTQPLSKLNYIFAEQPLVRQAAGSLVLTIYREAQELARGYELAVSAAIRQLLLTLLRADTRGVLGGALDADLVRLRPALDYVDQHLSEKITVEDVCGLLHLSYHYFIKLFRRVIGLSFIDYVNYKRVKAAERLLLTQSVSISEVGDLVGIPNMAQFYKLFKRHNHCSPKVFRQRMQGGHALLEAAVARS
ncbi:MULTISPECIES: AraC family transcriptional regulator [unclassified Paenibacillus]|uniref:AraC family transcriptional regulator n=1 Tax=unclassified Paenibacillus TaxID=185978 RepID=UPI0009310325|nr:MULTISPECIES: AraC family transcriptional regulator [unclassified Paenibacillus]